MKISYKKYELQFKRPAGTSRGVYNTRPVWHVFIEENGFCGVGECAPLPGLSTETPEQIEELLENAVASPKRFLENPLAFQAVSSLQFAIETALLMLKQKGSPVLFPSEFTSGKSGIPINGLIWMGDLAFMKEQIQEKLAADFSCLKLKIGALNFQKELELLQAIRADFTEDELSLRVDANGAFTPTDAERRLKQLSKLQLHSIEQPIACKQYHAMAQLCIQNIVPIALDEELIGINTLNEKRHLLETIRPQYIVLKPSLHGGLLGCEEWIELADALQIEWWITSYLESNIGLNALAQWTFTKNIKGFQGLGTGQLFTNNFNSPLEIRKDKLWFAPEKQLELPTF